MAYTSIPKETSWKIIYSRFEGVERRAVELLSREIGEQVLRKPEVYTLHVLPCEKETDKTEIPACAVVVGTYAESGIIRKYINKEEISENGYIVKVVRNPLCIEGSIVLISAIKEKMLYRAAAAFLDDYSTLCAPLHGGMHVRGELFKEILPEYTISEAPKVKGRSIFAWGHAINDYRQFLADMARLGLNQLILWNDYKPLNSHDIVECAHSYGIELIWGFAWGWSEGGCSAMSSLDEESLAALKKDVIYQYENVWHGIGDGIYFQSFTEKQADNIKGKNIASVVTDFVNEVVGELLSINPELHIQFGLHATSVKNHLYEIARVDKRVEILWEDCGLFPYAYVPESDSSEDEFKKTLDFTKKIIELRGKDAPVGLVFKGFATLDWTNKFFVHQAGRFILGENSERISKHDRALRSDAWRIFTSQWLKSGDRAKRMANHIYSLTGENVNLCMAGLFDGGIWIPEAICARIFENPTLDYSEIVKTVCARNSAKIE